VREQVQGSRTRITWDKFKDDALVALTSFLNALFERWTDNPGNTPMLLKAHRRATPIYDHTLILITLYVLFS
jgi:hypothetical protein